MPRKYDRYGFNRQYRRNPARKRNPFPYRLPFMSDYRINKLDDPDYSVSAATASRYRTAIGELVSKHGSPSNPSPSMKRPLQKLGWNSTDRSKRQRVLTWGALAGAGLKTGSILMREKMNQFKNQAILDWGSKYAVGGAYGRRAITVAELLAF